MKKIEKIENNEKSEKNENFCKKLKKAHQMVLDPVSLFLVRILG